MAKGIKREKIISVAEDLIAENGLDHFSLHVLAERLGIKTASLYTHISGLDDVLSAASQKILTEFQEREMSAIAGKERAAALYALAASERQYAKTNASYYELIMNLQLSNNAELREAASRIIEPVMTVLSGYRISETKKIDTQRMIRACIFGFVSQEKHGYFAHLSRSADESFDYAVRMIARGIEATENEK